MAEQQFNPPPVHMAPPTTPVKAPVRLKGHWSTWISVVLLLAMLLWMVFFPLFSALEVEAQAISARAGKCFGAAVVGGVLGLLAYYIGRRSYFAGNVAFSLIILLHLSGAVLMDLNQARAARADRLVSGIDRIGRSVEDNARQQLEEQGYVELDATQLSAAAAQMEQLAAEAGGVEGEVAMAAAQIQRDLGETALEFQLASGRCADAGGIDPATMTLREELVTRKALFITWRDTNERFTQWFRDAPDRYRELLTQRGVPQGMVNSSVVGFKRGMRPDLALRFRDAERRMAERSLDVLVLLDEQWGKWEYDAESEMAVFVDEAVVQRYNELMLEINAIFTEQVALQKQIYSESAGDPGGG